jgi:hypothetical protein
MAELFLLFKGLPTEGPFDRSDGNRLTPSRPWPGLWSLPPEDQAVVAEVSLGRRRRALLTDGQHMHLVEHQPGIREVNGDMRGYIVRTLPLPAPSVVAPAPEPPARTPRRESRWPSRAAWLACGALLGLALGGAGAAALAYRARLFAAPAVPAAAVAAKEVQQAVPPAPDRSELRKLEERLARLEERSDALAQSSAARRPDESGPELAALLRDGLDRYLRERTAAAPRPPGDSPAGQGKP